MEKKTSIEINKPIWRITEVYRIELSDGREALVEIQKSDHRAPIQTHQNRIVIYLVTDEGGLEKINQLDDIGPGSDAAIDQALNLLKDHVNKKKPANKKKTQKGGWTYVNQP